MDVGTTSLMVYINLHFSWTDEISFPSRMSIKLLNRKRSPKTPPSGMWDSQMRKSHSNQIFSKAHLAHPTRWSIELSQLTLFPVGQKNELQKTPIGRGLDEEKISFLWFFFFFVSTKNAGWGTEECKLSNISVSTSKTGHFVGDKPEWEVTISNDSLCSQSNLKLQCKGFTSAEEVDPALFRKIDDQYCLVYADQPILQDSPISFKYASSAPWCMYDLPPANSQINCSWSDGREREKILLLSCEERFK